MNKLVDTDTRDEHVLEFSIDVQRYGRIISIPIAVRVSPNDREDSLDHIYFRISEALQRGI